MTQKKPTQFRLTIEAKELIRLLAEKLGLSDVGVVELAVREMARREKVKRS